VQQSLSKLQDALLVRFASRRAYDLFEDVTPALEALRAEFPNVTMGVASNSDSRILQAMRELDLGRFFNLQLEGDIQEGQDQQRRQQVGGPPPTLSYTILAEKPSPRFFELAIDRAEPFVFTSSSSASATKEGNEDEQQPRLRSNQVLFVGDHLLEDFRAARDAGMHALWLRRAPLADHTGTDQKRSPARIVGPHNEDAERILEQEGLTEEEKLCTISSMLGVVEWLRARR
jgi:FMN phosphatase YigB (HAD superfamily)